MPKTSPSSAAWSRAFAEPRRPAPFRAFSPARSEIAPMLALAHRIASYVGEERAARRQPIFNLTLPNMAPPERDASQVRALSSFVFTENTRPEQGRRAFFPRRTVPTPALFPFVLASRFPPLWKAGEGMRGSHHPQCQCNIGFIDTVSVLFQVGK